MTTTAVTAPDLDRHGSVSATPPRPIFVIGALRSGASLLTLALGQHPNIVQTLETNWFDRFALGLQQAYAEGVQRRNSSHLDVMGIELEDFFAHFGEAVNRLILSPYAAPPAPDPPHHTYRPTRWVDGTDSNCFNVFALLRLFPEAKFIHVVRDVNEVVASLTTPELRILYRSRHVEQTPKAAHEQWLKRVRACLDAEQAFGSETVRRVRRADLIAAPEPTLRRLLTFLDEPFSATCLRPLR